MAISVKNTVTLSAPAEARVRDSQHLFWDHSSSRSLVTHGERCYLIAERGYFHITAVLSKQYRILLFYTPLSASKEEHISFSRVLDEHYV